MRGNTEGRASAIWTTLAAGSLELLGPALAQSGRLAWLAPLVCLPLALGVARLWRRLGDLRVMGRPVLAIYYLWALVLLAECAGGYARRLELAARGDSPWLYLGTAAALCLWLCRGRGIVPARTGRLLFLLVAVVLGVTILLSLPGLRWENLWPVERADAFGLPGTVLLCMSLAGYGVYGLCLPGADRFPRKGGGPWAWAAAICVALAGLLLSLTGSFGPALAAERPEPALLLLEGVQVPGVFRHGEAALEGGLALADLTGMAVLAYGCKALWGRLAPKAPGWFGPVSAGAAILGAGFLPAEWLTLLATRVVPAGNLVLGIAIPALAILTGRTKESSTFCGENETGNANVGGKNPSKKS